MNKNKFAFYYWLIGYPIIIFFFFSFGILKLKELCIKDITLQLIPLVLSIIIIIFIGIYIIKELIKENEQNNHKDK